MENKKIRSENCTDCKCNKEACKKDTYLHSIKIMYAHLGQQSTPSEKALIKEIENELLVISGFNKIDDKEKHNYTYYDTERNKAPKFP
tara:strand:- start:12 stop:275 length:264 start_codon:yes stop_codon:yes gene_type:complete